MQERQGAWPSGSRDRAAGQKGARIVSIAALLALAMPRPAFASGDLVLVPEVPMMITMVILFVALIFPVNALIFKPIFRALDERAARILGARARAAHIAADADAILARYEESIRDARASAEAARKEAIAGARSEQVDVATRARADAERLVEQARGELAAAIEEARIELRTSTQELGRAAAQRILGRGL